MAVSECLKSNKPNPILAQPASNINLSEQSFPRKTRRILAQLHAEKSAIFTDLHTIDPSHTPRSSIHCAKFMTTPLSSSSPAQRSIQHQQLGICGTIQWRWRRCFISWEDVLGSASGCVVSRLTWGWMGHQEGGNPCLFWSTCLIYSLQHALHYLKTR